MQNTLSHCFPHIAKEWHPTRNGDLKPCDVSKSSGKKVWWLCKQPCKNKCCDCTHEYEATVDARTPSKSRRNGSGCPICYGRKLCCKKHSIWYHHKRRICLYWNLEKNISIFPTDISVFTHKKVWLEDPCCSHDRPSVDMYPSYIDDVKNNQERNLSLETLEYLDLSTKHRIFDWNSYNCVRCRHEWDQRPKDIITGKTDCPYCSNPRKEICKSGSIVENFPDIMKQWHPTKNEDIDPNKLSPNSSKPIWWLCPKTTCEHGCKHEWIAPPSNRTRVKSGCPFCSEPIKKVCKHMSAGYLYPHLFSQLHPSKNKKLDIYSISPYSGIKAVWICPLECEHGCVYEWETTFYQRVKVSKCSIFYKGTSYQCQHKRLSFENNKLFQQIHPSLNTDIDVDTISSGSNIKIWWQCPIDEEHIWRTSVAHRHIERTDCPVCCQRNRSSKMEIEWIRYLSYSHPNIISTLSTNGQYTIPNSRYQCDGFCPDCNTVFEFHGDFWHGNPDIYDSNDVNRVTKKTYGELYDNTLKKKQLCTDLGYNYVSIWENDWLDFINAVRLLQQIFRTQLRLKLATNV